MIGFLAQLAVEGTVLALMGLGLAASLDGSAQLRRRALLAVLVGLVVVPMSAAVSPARTVEVHVGSVLSSPAANPIAEDDRPPHRTAFHDEPDLVGFDSPTPAQLPETRGLDRSASWFSALPWVFGVIWFAGAYQALIAHAAERARIGRGAKPAPAHIRGVVNRIAIELGIPAPGVVVSAAARVPCVLGCGRPRLVLPVDALQWDDEALALALLHECIHIRRSDTWLPPILAAVYAAHWFNPLVARLHGAVIGAVEEVVDEDVLSTGAAPVAYGRMLLAASHPDSSGLAHVPAVAGGRLERRIERIVGRRPPVAARGRGIRWIVAAGTPLMVGGVTVVLACTEIAPRLDESWTLVEEVRIGSVAGPGPTFSEIGDVAPGPGHQLHVRQIAESRILVVSPDDTASGTIGREGDGPGEFRALWATGAYGDTVWATDLRTMSGTTFGADGTVLRHVRLSPEAQDSLGSRLRPLAVARDGSLLIESTGSDGQEAGLFVVGPSGLVTQVASTVPERGGVSASTSAGRVVVAPAVRTGSRVAVSPDGQSVLVVHAGLDDEAALAFRVLQFDLRGDTLLDTRVPFEPKSLPASVADSIRTGWIDQLSNFLPRSEAQSVIAESLYLPEHLPPVSDVVVAENGEIWIRREPTFGDSPARWLVLDQQGERHATLEVPAGLEIHWIAGEGVWGSVTDELDVPYVVGYRIQR